jgi:glycosyltransferase involved in cell wall biosynthesis
MRKVSIVIPTLNEERGIAGSIDAIPRKEISGKYGLEIIVVDGLSTDRTVEIARSLGARVVLESRKGYGRAYKSGFAAASGDFIVTLDGDGTYPAAIIPGLLESAEKEGLDFITTNRFGRMRKGAMSFRNKVGNKVLTVAVNAVHGTPFRDSQSGMWLIRRSAWERIKGSVKGDGMEFSQELKIEAFRKGLRCKEVPIEYHLRHGEAKLNPWKDGVRNLAHVFRKRLQK